MSYLLLMLLPPPLHAKHGRLLFVASHERLVVKLWILCSNAPRLELLSKAAGIRPLPIWRRFFACLAHSHNNRPPSFSLSLSLRFDIFASSHLPVPWELSMVYLPTR